MDILDQLRKITKEENIFVDEPMKRHTSFRTGGIADYLVTPENEKEIVQIMNLHVPKTFIGNGSNLIVKDGGIRGVVVKLIQNHHFQIEENKIIAESGILLAKLSMLARDHDLTGLEFACGIPGTLGGAIMMNAGAYGGEMAEVVVKTRFVNADGKIEVATEHDFGYRNSIFKKNHGVILSAELLLKKGDHEQIANRMKELILARNTKQPVNMPSAGSTFKRPEGYYAGKLIEDCGLKGYCIGGAMVSDLHAGFIVNKGGATSKDILDLIAYVQNTVWKVFGVLLEPEVRVIGED